MNGLMSPRVETWATMVVMSCVFFLCGQEIYESMKVKYNFTPKEQVESSAKLILKSPSLPVRNL